MFWSTSGKVLYGAKHRQGTEIITTQVGFELLQMQKCSSLNNHMIFNKLILESDAHELLTKIVTMS